ncbi:MAG: DUF481 domain-containing protein [Myxococcota bacterium]
MAWIALYWLGGAPAFGQDADPPPEAPPVSAASASEEAEEVPEPPELPEIPETPRSEAGEPEAEPSAPAATSAAEAAAHAEADEAEESRARESEKEIVVDRGPTRWKPPEPDETGWDWIRFDTGEWLKGEIKGMREDDLEFESDQLDDLVLDWDDVDRLQSSRTRTFVLYDGSTITGTVIMVDDVIAVGAGENTVRVPRELLLKIIPGEEREIDFWTMRGGAGLSLRSGNTDETELTGSLLIRRESVDNRFTIEYDGAYGVIDNSKNKNNHRGEALLDSVITPRFFWYPADFIVFSDEFQNIAYRLTPAAGVGYYPVRNDETELQVRLGAGYQYTRFDEVQDSESNDADTAVAILELGIDTDITSIVDFIANYRLQLGVPDVDETNHRADATVSIEITKHVDLDVGVVWDRNESPEREADGSEPDRDDVRTLVELAFEF